MGLQGIAEKDVQTVRDIVDRTLDDVIEYVQHLQGWAGSSLPNTGSHHTHSSMAAVWMSPLWPCCSDIWIFQRLEFLMFL